MVSFNGSVLFWFDFRFVVVLLFVVVGLYNQTVQRNNIAKALDIFRYKEITFRYKKMIFVNNEITVQFNPI